MPDSSVSHTERARRLPGAELAGPGFTLLEMLVGLSLLLMVLFGIYLVYDTCQATFWSASAKTQLQESARMAMEQMRQEIRMAGYDPSGTGQPAVQGATGTSLSFVTDVEDDHVSDLVRYDLDTASGTLRRTVRTWTGSGWGTAAVSTLATNVASLSFQYFPSATLPGLKRIGIRFQESKPVSTQPIQQFQVATDVLLRNL